MGSRKRRRGDSSSEEGDSSAGEDLAAILGTVEDDGLAGLEATAPPVRMAFPHLDVAAVAKLVAGPDSADAKRNQLRLLYIPAIRDDPHLGPIGRDMVETVLLAAAETSNRFVRSGLITAFISALEARTTAVAVSAGLADPFVLRAAMAAHRGRLLDFSPVAIATKLRRGSDPLPDSIIAILSGPAVRGTATGPPAGPSARATKGATPAARAASPGGRGGRGGGGRGGGRTPGARRSQSPPRP